MDYINIPDMPKNHFWLVIVTGTCGGGVLYKSKRYVPPLKVFFVPLWSENEFSLNPFWAGTGYELFCHFNPR